MGSRSKKAILGFATDLSGSALLVIAGFIAVPIVLRLTSPSLYGFWVITLSVLGYLALSDLGLATSLTRLVAGLTNDQDSQSLNRLVSSAFFAFCVAGIVFLGIGLGVSHFIPVWFKIAPSEASSVIPAYQIAVFSGAIALPLSLFSAIVSGFQRMAVDNTVRNSIALIAIGVSIVLLFSGWGVVSLAISSLFSVVASSAINLLYVRRLCPSLKINVAMVNRADLIRLLTFGGYFQLGRIANTVAISSDSMVIAAASGAAMVTPYTFTSKLAGLFSVNIASKMPIAVFPAMSEMFARNQNLRLQRVFVLLTRYATRLAVVSGVFFAIANYKFVSLWVGPQYFGGPLLNAVLVYWILQDTIYRGTTAIVFALGEMRNWMIASLAEAALNLGLSILLVGPLGIVGVALGTSIGKTLTTAWYVPYWICRKIKLPIRYFIWRGIVYTVLRSLPGVVLTVWLAHIFPTNWDWVWVILVGLIAVLTNVILFEGIELAKPSGLSLRERVRQLLALGVAEGNA
jgi:O-antigen/teichoic acid export membrane protein